MHCQSLHDVFAIEVVDNRQAAFPVACSAGDNPKGKGQTPLPVLPPNSWGPWWNKTAIWTLWPSLAGECRALQSQSCEKLHRWSGKWAGLNKTYPAPLPNHSYVTQGHRENPLESIFFVNMVNFAAFWPSLVEHHLNWASEGVSRVRLKGL